MNYSQIRKMDVANGPGVRVSIFFSGCTHHCKGCFNKEYWDFNYGKPYNDTVMLQLLFYLRENYITGLSLLGGEPFDQDLSKILNLVEETKIKYPNKDIWIWTGYKFEDLINNEDVVNILKYVDIIVDGKFVEELKNLKLVFRGSSNQRIIDVQQSLNQNKIILKEEIMTKGS